MKRKMSFMPSLAALGLLVCGLAVALGQQPEFVRSEPIGSGDFGLGIRTGTNGWVTVESSPDLRTWSEVASLATTNSGAVFVDEVAVQSGDRFYRLREPGTPVEVAEARWPGGRQNAYRFQLEAVNFNRLPNVLVGTVTVINGQKSVSNVTGNGQPIDSPDPGDFPSVEELFAALKAAQVQGCHVVYALYDATLGFPVRCIIDRRGVAIPPASPGTAVEYRISAMEFLAQPGLRVVAQTVLPAVSQCFQPAGFRQATDH